MLLFKQFWGLCVQKITFATIELTSTPITDSSVTLNTTWPDLYTVKRMAKSTREVNQGQYVQTELTLSVSM